MILRKCLRENLLVPHLAKSGANDDISFEGATVIEPKKAFYEVPIATLDFASLYPSIMQAYNLCYSTLVTEREAQKLDPASYEKSPAGHIFIRSQTKRGILPQILDELLAARKRAKKYIISTGILIYPITKYNSLSLRLLQGHERSNRSHGESRAERSTACPQDLG